MSPAFEQIFGRRCAEVESDAQIFVDAVHEEDRDCFRAFWADPTAVETKYRVVRPDGAVRSVRTKCFPILDASGKTFRIAGITEDITLRKEMENALQQLEEEQDQLLLQAQNEEREMLARELHDGVGQLLVGLHLKLASKQKNHHDLSEEMEHLQKTIETVSKISRLLHPPELDMGDLTTAIADHLTSADATTRPLVKLTSQGVEPPLTASAKNHLYRIVQEAVTNVRKHAGADSVTIGVDWNADPLALRVEDNGIGFPEQLEYGLGLRSIQTRAWALDGRADWSKNTSGGMTLQVSVPLAGIVARSAPESGRIASDRSDFP